MAEHNIKTVHYKSQFRYDESQSVYEVKMKKKKTLWPWLLLLLPLLLLLVKCEKPVSLQIIEEETNIPIVQATVRCSYEDQNGETIEKTFQSDAKGKVGIRNFPKWALLSVNTSKDGYTGDSRQSPLSSFSTNDDLCIIKLKNLILTILEVDAQLGVACTWPDNIDVDLYVENINTGEVCCYGQVETSFGFYLEDIISRNADNEGKYELFFQQKIVPGTYRVYVNIYAASDYTDKADVTGFVVMFPGTVKEQRINFRPIRLTNPKETVIAGILTVTETDISFRQ